MWIRKNKKIYINLLDYKVYDLLQNLKYTFRFKEKILTCKIQIKYWKKPKKNGEKNKQKIHVLSNKAWPQSVDPMNNHPMVPLPTWTSFNGTIFESNKNLSYKAEVGEFFNFVCQFISVKRFLL